MHSRPISVFFFAILGLLGLRLSPPSATIPSVSSVAVVQGPIVANPLPLPSEETINEAVLTAYGQGFIRIELDGIGSNYGEVSYSYSHKNISFQWHYFGPDQEWHLDGQSEPVRFSPTAVAVEAPGVLLVAGWQALTGLVHIERWTLHAPSPLPGMAINPITGEVAVEDFRATIRTRETVMTITGGDPIRTLFSVHRDTSKMYAQFQGSGAVALLDPVAGLITPLWAPAVIPGVQQAAGLDNLGEYKWSVNHSTAGYVYLFGYVHGTDIAFVLLDTDRDGSVDVSGMLPQSSLNALGFQDVEKYIQWY